MARAGKGKKTGDVAVGLEWHGTDVGRFLKMGLVSCHERGCGTGRRRAASQQMHVNHACRGGTAPGRLRPSSGGVTVGLWLLLRILNNGACAVVVMTTSAVAAWGIGVWRPS